MKFLDAVLSSERPEIEVFGRGIHPIDDKWDGLAPYRYSLAVENSVGPDYWTEKVADCFLCWTVPIYYGCTNLETYFPREAFIQIDINRPDEAIENIRRQISHEDWVRRFPAIQEARRRVLDDLQFFPYLTKLIK